MTKKKQLRLHKIRLKEELRAARFLLATTIRKVDGLIGINYLERQFIHTVSNQRLNPNFITLEQHKSGWKSLTLRLGNLLLDTTILEIIFKAILKHLSPGTNSIILKIQYESMETRNIGPMQTISHNMNLEELVGLYEFFLNGLSDFYKETPILKIVVIFKNLGLEAPVQIKNISSVQENIKPLHKFFQFMPYLPLSFDVSTWGTIIKNTTEIVLKNGVEVLIGEKVITHFNELYQYSVKYIPNGLAVTVYYRSKKTSKKFHLLTEFYVYSLEPSNPTNITIEISNYTIVFKDGVFISGSYPVYVDYMKKDVNKPENWGHRRILTMDLETRTINNIITPYAIGFYDGVKFTSFYLSDFSTIDEFMLASLKFLLNKDFNGYSIYVHNLSGFDGIFLMKYLLQLSKSNLLKPVIREGKIVSLPFHHKSEGVDVKLTFLDSINLLPHSLRKLAKSIGVKTQKELFPYDFVNNPNISLEYIGSIPGKSYFQSISDEEYNDYVTKCGNCWSLKAETLKYLKADCVSLYEVLMEFGNLIFDSYKVDITTTPSLPSLAMKLYRSMFMSAKNIPLIEGQMYNITSQAYYGGVVDVYKPYGTNLYYYDVNSLYPTAIMKPMPIGGPIYTNSETELNLDTFFGFIRARIECPLISIPVLPVKDKGRLICPTGTWEGWYFSEELRNARDNFGYIITPLEGYKFESKVIFNNYVQTFYNMKRTSDGPMKQIAKLLLNSLYGRFGMSPTLEETTITASTDEVRNMVPDIQIDSQPFIKDGLNISVPIAAAISAYSRIIISSYKNIEGYVVFYSDTDSIVLNKPLPEHIINKDLGGMKLEYEVLEGVFLGPKLYALKLNNGEYVFKIRGLSRNNLSFEDMLSLLDDGDIQTSHTLWFRNMSEGLITLKEQLFSISASSSKRQIIRNSSGRFIDTKPYHINR